MYAMDLPVSAAELDYLARERDAADKSEYLNGTIVAMAGASREHNEVVMSLTFAVMLCLRGTECRAYGSDMRVRTTEGNYCYPDLSIVCGKPRFTDIKGDVLLDPVVIMEVLSPTTESLDRGEKLRSYQQTSSVKEIVLISQHRRRVERYERQGGGLWLYEALEGEAAVLKLVSCGGEIPLGEFYDRIEL